MKTSLLALLFVVAACGDSNNSVPTQPDGDTDPIPDAPADAQLPPDGPDVNPACLAPFVMPVDTNAQSAAQTELTALAPTAEMTWADVRNTLMSVNGFVVQLPACTGSSNAFDFLASTLTAHPALFQIDPNEWTFGNVSCSDVLSSGFHPLTIRRNKYGSYPIANDVFTAVADVQNGVVILRNFSGTYIPKPSQAVLDGIAACPDLTQDIIRRHIFTDPFVYQAYEQAPAPACTVEGNHQYTLHSQDAVTYDPTVMFNWTEDTQVTFQRQGTATVVLDAGDYTPVLVNSSANCAVDGHNNIGWQRTYNSVTAEVLYDHATPDPFCTVCFTR